MTPLRVADQSAVPVKENRRRPAMRISEKRQVTHEDEKKNTSVAYPAENGRFSNIKQGFRRRLEERTGWLPSSLEGGPGLVLLKARYTTGFPSSVPKGRCKRGIRFPVSMGNRKSVRPSNSFMHIGCSSRDTHHAFIAPLSSLSSS